MSRRRSITLVPAPSHDLAGSDRYAEPEEERLSRLARIIEGEIVPRLLISLGSGYRTAARPAPDRRPSFQDVAELARLLLAPQGDQADAYVEVMREQGASLECIYTELLAPAARRLGELWERDECDFAELTTGLRRLVSVLRQVGSPGRASANSRPG